jgi:hypothetical protein
MSWLVYRTHRLALLGVVLYLCVAAGLGIAAHAAGAPCPNMTPAGVEACLRDAMNSPRNTLTMATLAMAAIFPVVVGVFLGAPLVASDVSSGTARLVWTQGVTRRRWLAAQLGVVSLASLAAATALTVLVPWATRDSADDFQHFDFLGLVPAAYSLFALLLGAAVGAVTRRVVGGMALTVVAWTGIRLAMLGLRPHYMRPITTTNHNLDGLILRVNYVDAAGNVIPQTSLAHGPVQACLQTHFVPGGDALASCGLHLAWVVQPEARFWPFQFIEAGVFVALALVALGVLILAVRRA